MIFCIKGLIKPVGSVEIVSRLIYGVTLNILIFELLCVPKRVIELFSIATTDGGKKTILKIYEYKGKFKICDVKH